MMRKIVALSLGLSSFVPSVASAQPEVPPPDASAGDPTAPDPGPMTPDPGAGVPAPTVQPTALPKPEFDGKGLLIGAGAVTAFSWVSRIIALGVGMSIFTETCNVSNDSCAQPVRKAQTAAAFTALAPISQFIATGLVIPGGVLRGRYDGWDHVANGGRARKGRALLVSGAVLFGVFTAASIALRPAVIFGCTGNLTQCGNGKGAYAGYMLGVQASDTLSTAGAGMMSYGIAYQRYTKTHGPKVAIAPFSSRGAYGVSLAGRF